MIVREGGVTYYETPKKPLREVLKVLCGGKSPPKFVTTQHYTAQLTEEQQMQLQDWCSMHVRPNWLTGIGTIEAADAMVREAVDNCNIRGPGEG